MKKVTRFYQLNMIYNKSLINFFYVCIASLIFLKKYCLAEDLISGYHFSEPSTQKIQDDEKALPGKLSDDEKRTLNGSCASDVYKIVSSIKGDDYERKKEWAKFLGVKVEVSKAKTKNSGEAEDTEKATSIRQQLETIALDIELDKMITKCEGPIHEYLSFKEMMSLKQTSRESDIKIPILFAPERTKRQNKLKQYKDKLDAYIQNPGSIKEELKSIAEHVEELFDEVTQLDNESPKFKA